jgi:hypothetical protein
MQKHLFFFFYINGFQTTLKVQNLPDLASRCSKKVARNFDLPESRECVLQAHLNGCQGVENKHKIISCDIGGMAQSRKSFCQLTGKCCIRRQGWSQHSAEQ